VDSPEVRFYTRDVTLSVARVFMWLGWISMEQCFCSFFFKRSFLRRILSGGGPSCSDELQGRNEMESRIYGFGMCVLS